MAAFMIGDPSFIVELPSLFASLLFCIITTEGDPKVCVVMLSSGGMTGNGYSSAKVLV
jgi:hypothetical protein